MSEFFLHMSRGWYPLLVWDFLPPFFLGVAIGLELRIRLWHMLWLAFGAVGSVCLRKLFVFALQALLPLRRCPFWMSDFFGSHAAWVFPSSLFLPSEGRDGGGRSRDALVLLPEGFPLLSLDLVQREGWRSLWSRVRCTRARFCLLGSFVDCGSRSCSLAADSCSFSVLGCLSRLISARSGRWWDGWGFRVPLQLGSSLASRSSAWVAGMVLWARSWSNGSRVRSCCSRCHSACRAQFGGRDAVGVDRLIGCFPLCSRGVIVGGLRTASGFTAFALVVSVWPVAVFWPLTAPPKLLWRDRSQLVPLSFTAAALPCSPGGRCDR